MALTMAIIGFGKSANRYHIPYIKERDIKIKYIYNHRRHREKEQGFYFGQLPLLLLFYGGADAQER